MPDAGKIRALVFDAYGTLFDVFSIGTACEQLFPGRGTELTRTWRTKQLEYSWLRSLMGRYADFESITRDALRYSCKSMGLALDAAAANTLLRQYRHLAPHAEVRDALPRLGSYKRAILSNGSPGMLQDVVSNAGLSSQFDAVISVDSLKVFKPSPAVYELATKQLGVAASQVGFVSSNFWDISGATSFGFRTFWINRGDAVPDELGFQPQRVLKSLDELGAYLD